MNKLKLAAFTAATVFLIAPLATAATPTVSPTTTQAISADALAPTKAPLARIVLTDKTGVKVLEVKPEVRVSEALVRAGYAPSAYRTETSEPIVNAKTVEGSPVFLFKIEYRGSSQKIVIPAPVTTLRVNGLPPDTTIVQAEGSDGIGILTTVVSRDLSQSKKLNQRSKGAVKAQRTDTLTVVRNPEPRVVLTGTEDEVTDLGSYRPVQGECENGSAVPSTVNANIIAIHRASCIQFPEITSYGTYRDSCPITCDHHDGIAVDIMVSGDLGWLVAQYFASNASMYDINYLIYEQQIWEPELPYWRKMDDRGSITANHFDHVHVSVNRPSSDSSSIGLTDE